MPELPDLENFSRNLSKIITGKKVEKIAVVNDSKLKTSATSLKKALQGEKVKSIYREGKELHIQFSDDHVLGLHLMLHGDLNLFEKTNDKKYPIIEFYFDDETGLALSDYQGAAKPTLDPEKKDAPDALSDELTYEYLKGIFSKKKSPIKTVLLDQKVVRGIGNAYADEILYDARISPTSISNKIPDDKIKVLAKSIKSVLKHAISHIQKTHPDIITGEVRDFLKVHNAHKKTSPGGKPIHNTKINSRITYYTDEQVEYK